MSLKLRTRGSCAGALMLSSFPLLGLWRVRGQAPSRARLVHELGLQGRAPVWYRRDLFLLQEHLGMALQVGLQIRGEARLHVDRGERLAEGLLRHRITLAGV